MHTKPKGNKGKTGVVAKSGVKKAGVKKAGRSKATAASSGGGQKKRTPQVQEKRKEKKRRKKEGKFANSDYAIQSSSAPQAAETVAAPAAAASGSAPQRRLPLLALLDLNGVLVHRDAPGAATFRVRPGTLALLRALHGHVQVGFCSSMRPKNARRALKCISFRARKLNDAAVLEILRDAAVFAGEDYHFRNDVGVPLLPLRVPALEPWRMLRNLAHVWASKAARGHGASSTILCDDTPGKCPLSPRNVLIVPTWDGTGGEDTDGTESDVLSGLSTQLLAAAAALSEGADVRVWLDAASEGRS